jgi:hypothetical protein
MAGACAMVGGSAMGKQSWITACATGVIALTLTASAHAAPEPCGKNHYILSEPCNLWAVDAAIGLPGAVATDAQGNVYFSSPHLVFKVDTQGLLERVAGNGKAGFAGDGGPATEALLNFPYSYQLMIDDPWDYGEMVGGLAVDAAGNLYIADAWNDRVRRVDSKGVIVSLPAGDLSWPQGVALDASGALFVSDVLGILRKLAPDGTITALTENDCGFPRAPGLCSSQGVAADALGNAYVADAYCRVRKVSGGGVATVAGADTRVDRVAGYAFTCGYFGDGGPAISAAMTNPFGVATDSDGNLFIADTDNNCIRKVDAAGIITSVAGVCNFLVGGFSGDGGPATEALLKRPHGVALDGTGTLFIADTENRRVRKVTPDGLIVTVAGNGDELPN